MAGSATTDFSSSVQFTEDKSSRGEERTKYLTMKYGQHQMRLIKQRLKVEFWIDSELNRLYNIDEESGQTCPCDVDLDELLDMETSTKRRQFILEELKTCNQPETEIETFVKELLEKLDSL